MFAPKPRDYSQKLPKKMRRQALLSALSLKAESNDIIVLDSLNIEQPKTKLISDMLKKLNVEKKALIVLKESDAAVQKSVRNLPNAKTALVGALNVYDILKYDTFVITRQAVQAVEEVYGK